MSARIFIHPRNPMTVLELVNLYCARGYAIRTTLRGHIEVCTQQRRITSLSDYARKRECPQH